MRNNSIKIFATTAILFTLAACSSSNDSTSGSGTPVYGNSGVAGSGGVAGNSSVTGSNGVINSSNTPAPVVDNSGKHQTNWIHLHGAEASPSASACTECHGANLAGGITRVGCFSTPQSSYSGFVCHATNPVAVPTACVSCHGAPPNGTTQPNRANAHAKHVALASITCATCHSGAGFGTANHARANAAGGIAPATVSSLPASFQAKSFANFGYNPADGTCSGIICHGGLMTPKWDSPVSISCLDCHSQGTALQTPQYNSFYSGKSLILGSPVNLHRVHLLVNVPTTTTAVACTDCHNTAILASRHFAELTTPEFDRSFASTTIGGGSTRISNYVPYTTAVPSGSCTSSCHGASSPRNWVGTP